MTDTRYNLLALAPLSGYLRMSVKEKYIYRYILNKIFLAFNLSVKKRNVVFRRAWISLPSQDQGAALFMHINFKLGRMGKVFLSPFQPHTSQAFSTFVCCFIKANCTEGDEQTLHRIQQVC